jgi:hypothetical protein
MVDGVTSYGRTLVDKVQNVSHTHKTAKLNKTSKDYQYICQEP